MRCLLLISVALWSLVGAIPKRDLMLIKEVESWTEMTYKKIMQETLEFNIYKAQLALKPECEAFNWGPYSANEWQNALNKVFNISKTRNLTEDEIQEFVNQLQFSFITNEEMNLFLGRLVQCANGTYLERYDTYLLRSAEILDAFEHQAVPNIKKINDDTKQVDSYMYEAFLAFIYAESGNREIAFKKFRTKITRYDDRVVLTEARALEVQLHQPYMQLLLNTTIYTRDSILKCNIVNHTVMDPVLRYESHLNKPTQNYTDDEIITLSNMINMQVIPMDPVGRATVSQRLILCTNGIYAQLKRDTNLKRTEYIKPFKTEIMPKMQQVSEATRQSNVKLFKNYEDFATAADANEEEINFYLFIKELSVF